MLWIVSLLLIEQTCAQALSPRTFMSADGKKVLVATPLGYDKAKQLIFLKMKDGKEQGVPLKFFSADDRLFILDRSSELEEMLWIHRTPMTMRGRVRKADREALIKKYAFAAGSEAASSRFESWLRASQNEDGSWCTERRVAMTALAVLVYLGHGVDPLDEDLGDSVTRGIRYLVQMAVQNGGKLGSDFKDRHWVYDHALATMALAEAQIVCQARGLNIPRLTEAVKAAGDWILDHQHTSGSWDYGYDMSGPRGGDTSISSWHIQALRLCQLTGLWKDKDLQVATRLALEYLRTKQAANGGIGYVSPNAHGDHGFTLTGAGMYAFQIFGKAHDSVVRKGARFIEKNAKFGFQTAHSNLYAHYYYALTMKCRGGENWRFYNKLLGNQLITNQEEDGAWKNVGGGADVIGVATVFRGEKPFPRHYRSCLCALILQTPYRYNWPSLPPK